MLNAYGKIYKYLDRYSGDFYNCRRLFTYDGRPWAFLMGSRSIGKSTNLSIAFLLIKFLYGDCFAYVRRDDDELQRTKHSFFDSGIDIVNGFGDFRIDSMDLRGGVYTVEWRGLDSDAKHVEPIGSAIPLSLQRKQKSGILPGTWNILYDEFMVDDPKAYLGGLKDPAREYREMYSLYMSVDREKGQPYANRTRVFFLGNTRTVYTPILLHMDLTKYIYEDSKIVTPKTGKGRRVIIERTSSVRATECFKDAYSYDLADDEELAYAFENTGRDSSVFVSPLPATYGYSASLRFKGKTYGVYNDLKSPSFYIGPYRSEFGAPYSLDYESHDGTDLQMLLSWRRIPIIETLLYAFSLNRLRFTSREIKNAFLPFFTMIPT